MDKEMFTKRLVELRMKKGVSARDMSLSIGQSAGYINNIENGVNYPSMALFFYICDYLGVTPKEFFDTDMLVRILDEHREGKSNNGRRIWTVYVFLTWYRRFFVNEA